MSRDNDQWVTELKGERESALNDLRVSLHANLRKALSSRTRVDDSFLEDAVQDSMIRILDRIDLFAGRSQFLTWATSIAIRVAMGQLRRSRWKDVSLDDVVANAEFPAHLAIDQDSAPDDRFDRESLLSAMQRSIEQDLTEKQRTALMAELKGMPQDEIARQLGSNRNAIYKLTHDARKRLRAALEAAGYTAEDIAATVAS